MSARAASYFSRLAPARAKAATLPRLQPPRLMFRPSAAPMPFVELPPQPAPAGGVATPVRQAAPAQPIARTEATVVAPEPATEPTGPARIALAPGQTTERPRVASRPPTAAVGQSAQPGVATGEDWPLGRPVDHAAPIATPSPGRRQDRDGGIGDLPGSRAAAPHAHAASPQTQAVPLGMAADPRARSAPPTAPVAPSAVPRAEIRPAAAPAELRIGTLEVRVAAPPAAATTPAVTARTPPRRGPAGGPPGRIARPFALFGLGQS